MTNNKNQSTFKKTTLSIIVISAVTGGLIALEKSQTPFEYSVEDSYQVESLNREHVTQSINTTDADQLALIAEANLINQELDDYQPQRLNELQENIETSASDLPEAQIFAAAESPAPASDSLEKPVIVENEVLFSFASSEIDPSYFQSLIETAEFIKNVPENNETVWQVVGHTDRSGNSAYNVKLAEKRAQAVAAFLVDKGVSEEQLAIVTLGDSSPVHQARTVANNRLDRRVEIHAYQAEVTALVEQLNEQSRQLAAAEKRQQKQAAEQLQAKLEKQKQAAEQLQVKLEKQKTAADKQELSVTKSSMEKLSVSFEDADNAELRDSRTVSATMDF
ncbi:OmpA family protein [Psychromonas aquimarina]|uniref:OmpA family protein n=1 Tax=Psychromonas aquimarina TaxID=444919 RepID=UPI000424EAED|nr:OmpA family protein [Psychromonas aquimarina]